MARFDAAVLLGALGGSREMAELVVDSASSEFPAYFEQLQASVKRGDWQETNRLIHTMKGLAAQIGGLRLAASCKAAHDILRNGRQVDLACIGDLKREFAQLQALLDAWRAGRAG